MSDKVEIVEEIPDIERYLAMRERYGWGNGSREDSELSLKNHYIVSA